VAQPLGVDIVEAAWAIHCLADATMVRALRAVSTERGRDPRHFVLFAFGGKGPVHASGIAQALGITRVVVPPAPGLFSSLALLFSEVEHHFIQTYFHPTGEIDMPRLTQVLSRLEQQGRSILAAEGYTGARTCLERFADLRYAGQNSELTIPMPSGALTAESLRQLQEAFAMEHDKTYGYRSDGEPVQLMGLRLVARGLSEAARLPDRLHIATTLDSREARPTPRQAYFGPPHGWVETLLVRRQDLAHSAAEGPLIIEEYDATTVIPPGCVASLDAWNNICIDVR
jgi:N-methylhydantoinase A